MEAIKDDFAAAAAAHPQFKGVPAIFLQAPFYDGQAVAYQNGLSTEFLVDLGFTIPADIARFAPRRRHHPGVHPAGAAVGAELRQGAAVGDGERPGQSGSGGAASFRGLTPVKQGNLAYTDGELAGAIYFTTPLSLPYVLDRLVPLLDKAVAGGNPETVPRS